MDKVTLKNYRCFHGRQTARLAPLTLLVGENSSGKTSFMAMIRALWDIAYWHRIPDFKENPYDLGSFEEIVYHRGAKGGRVISFEAGFESTRRNRRLEGDDTRGSVQFSVTFGSDGTVPVPILRSLVRGKFWIEEHFDKDRKLRLRFGTPRGSWEFKSEIKEPPLDLTRYMVRPLWFSLRRHLLVEDEEESKIESLNGSPEITPEDLDQLVWRIRRTYVAGPSVRVRWKSASSRPYASAPVRSKPHRTYDPARTSPDPEGDYVPMYLASLYFQNKKAWTRLKHRLERFGQNAGLFDEITIKPLGRRNAEPFQVQVRKFGDRLKGPRRNLIDVGYGVSQVLPVIAELLRRDGPPMFLLQQPEVHLHPSAQAALGSLFCQVAGKKRQLMVETHSDHLLDRVRMDVRDRKTRLKPNDVSILFFERRELEVHIHSLRLDKEGNVLGAPPGYRRFFMEETTRSLGL